MQTERAGHLHELGDEHDAAIKLADSQKSHYVIVVQALQDADLVPEGNQ